MDDKRQIIGKLYALRAGLSLIHDENKKIKAKESAITKIDETVDADNKKMVEAKNALEYDSELADAYAKNGARDEKSINREKRGMFINPLNLIYAAIGCPIGLAAGYLYELFEEHFSGNPYSYTSTEMWMWGIGGALLGFIVGVFFSFLNQKDIVEETKKSKNKNINESNRVRTRVEYNEELIVSLRKEIKKLAGDRVNAVAEYNAEKDIVVPVVKSMFDALLNQYSSLLDSRDWKNLDLIIFYLETGRADTIKEALSHVDRQNQMDRLTEAVNEASATICKTLERSFASLENCINENFENLSYQLSKQHREQMGALKGIGSSLNSISSRVDQISVNSAMQTSLLNNININSNELANVATHIYEYGVKSY